MNVPDFEILILRELKTIIQNIIIKNPTLPIAVKQGERQGDAISKFLEYSFVNHTHEHQYFKESEASPTGKTKNPYDAKTYFEYKGHKELIWIDFKAVNIANLDSNPDSGTPDKIINHITNGHFYLVYIFVFYEGEENKLRFVQKEKEYVKAYFLKDISSTVRITPANQLQVNYSQPPEYRTREEFIELLVRRKKQSYERRLSKAQSALLELEKGIVLGKTTLDDILTQNKKQEDIIKNL